MDDPENSVSFLFRWIIGYRCSFPPLSSPSLHHHLSNPLSKDSRLNAFIVNAIPPGFPADGCLPFRWQRNVIYEGAAMLGGASTGSILFFRPSVPASKSNLLPTTCLFPANAKGLSNFETMQRFSAFFGLTQICNEFDIVLVIRLSCR